jgi:hypothetical protein
MLRSPQQIGFIEATDVTGRYELESGAFLFYEQALESLVQTTYRGTGGECFWAGLQSLVPASGAYIVVRNLQPAVSPADLAAVNPIDVGRQLAFVRHCFSLNTTEMSKMLLVERPTVYAWLDRKWDPKHENKGRIRKLYQVARAWHDMSKQPVGKLLREPVDGDTSLMDYLVRAPLEVAAIHRVLEVLRGLVKRQVETKQVRSVREVAKQRGFKPLTSVQEDERFDRFTKF